jgi:hypothetical protein
MQLLQFVFMIVEVGVHSTNHEYHSILLLVQGEQILMLRIYSSMNISFIYCR